MTLLELFTQVICAFDALYQMSVEPDVLTELAVCDSVSVSKVRVDAAGAVYSRPVVIVGCQTTLPPGSIKGGAVWRQRHGSLCFRPRS